ncbi:MAG: hypothetical protein MJZ20_01595 [Bacteroidaceae bacterium]|nr:hypothetical protein [Bacteroidaceae bacterium]
MEKIMDSILLSVKSIIGIPVDYVHFDETLLMLINSTFPTLYQLGVDGADGFVIHDENSKWSDITDNKNVIAYMKPYVAYKVKSMFDPGQTTNVIEAMDRYINECETRLLVELKK